MSPDADASRLVHFRWDLDKTYLHTEFDSVRMLVRTWLQKAHEKEGIPGASTLLQELIAAQSGGGHRVTFISGSPRQMRRVLTERLRLDGIAPDQFVLKPNLSNALRLRLRAIRTQIGYKLGALLETRLDASGVDELLFGDDAEQDALIYSLYADVLAGRVSRGELRWLLEATEIDPREADAVVDRFDALPQDHGAVVRRIFILLARRSPTARFDAFGARVVPVYNWLQAAALLGHDGWLPRPALARVALDMAQRGYGPRRMANSLLDLARRGFLDPSALSAAAATLREAEGDAGDVLHPVADALELAPPVIGPAAAFHDAIDYVGATREAQKYRRPASPLGGFAWLR